MDNLEINGSISFSDFSDFFESEDEKETGIQTPIQTPLNENLFKLNEENLIKENLNGDNLQNLNEDNLQNLNEDNLQNLIKENLQNLNQENEQSLNQENEQSLDTINSFQQQNNIQKETQTTKEVKKSHQKNKKQTQKKLKRKKHKKHKNKEIKEKKKKSKRRIPTKTEKQILKQLFISNQNPSPSEITEISQKIGWERRRVTRWFSNQKSRIPKGTLLQIEDKNISDLESLLEQHKQLFLKRTSDQLQSTEKVLEFFQAFNLNFNKFAQTFNSLYDQNRKNFEENKQDSEKNNNEKIGIDSKEKKNKDNQNINSNNKNDNQSLIPKSKNLAFESISNQISQENLEIQILFSEIEEVLTKSIFSNQSLFESISFGDDDADNLKEIELTNDI
ncbi:zinc finger protein [Anaeramoeba ignava]|uniref:Zinc finger protein n=1 Tax=Anaeramoeba ignava TaxID=1746090 RepID=A0A9Q0LIY8_ANAIG|nr:zinc finger protein [Anaeramoeba ignava]